MSAAAMRDYPRTELGLMSAETYARDPRKLGIMLARYKFVAKMLSGKDRVAEVGCGDGFGSRVVGQEVGSVTLFDADAAMVNDIVRRGGLVYQADITAGELPYRYDGVYSLDVIEHVQPERTDDFVRNIAASLAPHGVLVIGTPSLESQMYASAVSRSGHVNCMSGEDLRWLMGRYFRNVFMFGMNDEVVHTGFLPMSHYLFAVCTEAR